MSGIFAPYFEKEKSATIVHQLVGAEIMSVKFENHICNKRIYKIIFILVKNIVQIR